MTTEEIINHFFEGKCDPRDVAKVHAWLNENPAILKEYIGEEEWEDFQTAHILPAGISGKLWNRITNNTASHKVQYSYLRWVSVAASLILIIGLSWYYILIRQKKELNSVATTKSIFNNTPQKMTIALSDGSSVELLPNSTLSYPGNFSALKREVILNGEANFNIAKDEARPFSVHSNTVLITVLGTRFTVRSYEANTATKVILHEGKVMVKTASSSSQDNKNEYYLTPGDVFILKKANKQSRILHLEHDKDDCYVFNNYPLDVVFDQLQYIYKTKIIYNRAELGNRSFIGKIDKKDSLYNILKSIALLNHFSLHNHGDSLVISN